MASIASDLVNESLTRCLFDCFQQSWSRQWVMLSSHLKRNQNVINALLIDKVALFILFVHYLIKYSRRFQLMFCIHLSRVSHYSRCIGQQTRHLSYICQSTVGEKRLKSVLIVIHVWFALIKFFIEQTEQNRTLKHKQRRNGKQIK